MNDVLPVDRVDDDRPFEADLVQLFRQSALPRRLDIDRLVDGYQPPGRRLPRPRARDAAGPAAGGSQTTRPRRAGRWLAAAAIAVGLGLAIGLGGELLFPPKSALAQVAAEFKRVSSVRCSVMTTGLMGTKFFTLYWAAPGSAREQQLVKGEVVSEDIQPANRPGIHIFHSPIKTFRKTPAAADQRHSFPILILEKLATLQGKADRDLGQSTIGDVEARGFEIAARQLLPQAGAADKLRVWYDPKTMRPLRIEAELTRLFAIMRIGDFVWNEPSDKWFETTPPAGYEERKFELPPTAESVNDLVKAFRIYAKYCGGRYPDGDMIDTEKVNAELYHKMGMVWAMLMPRKQDVGVPAPAGKDAKGAAATREKRPEVSEKVQEYLSAQAGFSQINLIRQFPVDLVYHSKRVGPHDRDKVLLRWRLDSGDYQVIFGDLHSEAVSAERLKELERNF